MRSIKEIQAEVERYDQRALAYFKKKVRETREQVKRGD